MKPVNTHFLFLFESFLIFYITEFDNYPLRKTLTFYIILGSANNGLEGSWTE